MYWYIHLLLYDIKILVKTSCIIYQNKKQLPKNITKHIPCL